MFSPLFFNLYCAMELKIIRPKVGGWCNAWGMGPSSMIIERVKLHKL